MRRDPLIRAVGALGAPAPHPRPGVQPSEAEGLPDSRPWVVDATAGFGHDAVLLAAAGFRVLAIERNPQVAAVLEDGLRRLRSDEDLGEIIRRIELRQGESIDLLGALAPAGNPVERPGVVLLDPMFPPRTRHRSALPPKPMQILRRLLGSDPDTLALLDAARRAATRRVIVKRADDGPPLGAEEHSTRGPESAAPHDSKPGLAPTSPPRTGPIASVGGRTVRFDIYSVTTPLEQTRTPAPEQTP